MKVAARQAGVKHRPPGRRPKMPVTMAAILKRRAPFDRNAKLSRNTQSGPHVARPGSPVAQAEQVEVKEAIR